MPVEEARVDDASSCTSSKLGEGCDELVVRLRYAYSSPNAACAAKQARTNAPRNKTRDGTIVHTTATPAGESAVPAAPSRQRASLVCWGLDSAKARSYRYTGQKMDQDSSGIVPPIALRGGTMPAALLSWH